MQIIIPMSGQGRRFLDAGYEVPKPLIIVDKKPIIEHVVNLFPKETSFIFICNKDHLKMTQMRSVLKRIAPTGKIIEIKSHKLGPVYAVSKIFDSINDEEEVIVNYCDFSSYWDYKDFLKLTRHRNADGAIVAYRGFHPHMLGSTNYAFMKEKDQWLIQIKEKEPFTSNRMLEYASNGTYYFKKGSMVKEYFAKALNKDLSINGEYYVSLVYNEMIADRLKISIYEVQHMLQWGSPQDLEEYQYWSHLFSSLVDKISSEQIQNLNIVIPMAGAGKRFIEGGYTTPKPLISVSGQAMINQVMKSLGLKGTEYFICHESLKNFDEFKDVVSKNSNSVITYVDKLTQGQACSAHLAIKTIDNIDPIIISACDSALIYDKLKLKDLINEEPELIVFTFKNYPGANKKPKMYGWVKADKDRIIKTSIKSPLSDTPNKDHGIVGTFYFKNKFIYEQCFDYIQKHQILINDEYYIDSMIEAALELGYLVKNFEIDHFLCFGTPDDLKTFNYWQSFFHKCDWHPYDINHDSMVPENQKQTLIKQSLLSLKEN